MMRQGWAIAFMAAVGLVGTATGCSTESFCFSDCNGADTGGTGTGATGGTAGGGTGGTINFGGTDGGGIGNFGGLGDGGPDACIPNPPEICNGVDDDCNGLIDDGIDWTDPKHCGTCDNNCTQLAHTINQTCTPPTTQDGTVAGTCKYDCETDFYDLDPTVEGCEYQCPWNPNGTNTVDTGGEFGCGRDDDCDGQIDEDLDTCADVNNCGKCGRKCALPHVTAHKCVTTATSGQQCTYPTNTDCEIDTTATNGGCEQDWWDANKSSSDGCEYNCTQTNGGKEICDGLDNDCDGLIDNADPSLETDDTSVGKACFGGTQGECAAASHQGISKCIGAVVKCCDPDSNNVSQSTNTNFPATGVRNGVCDTTTGNQVIKPGELSETCNNKDDDCNGTVDDNLIDDGKKCGNGTGICVQGTEQCQSGTLVCVGKVDPGTETCNGQDDDCDGVIDGIVPSGTPTTCTTNANCAAGQFCAQVGSTKQCVNTPPDAVGDCAPPGLNLPVPAPCQKGTLSCTGGVVQCVGYVGPTGTTDACGVDSNCDGQLTNQPDLTNDVNNCGQCGKKCGTSGDHGQWACQNSVCVRTGCDAGFINCDGNTNDCERACTFVSSTEQCNGIDDNCDCQIDNNITNKPTPVQVCGVSSSASDTGCTTGVTVSCAGSQGWSCTFPSGYCTGTKPNYCTGTQDLCDGKDNNCNGATDEAYTLAGGKTQGYLTQPCASDDGLPPPGDGACRGTGTYVCASNQTSTVCNAVKNLAAAGPELCDGIDNDCDGSVDEPFSAKGSNTTYWVKPAVTQVKSNLWISRYEMSRVGATATNPGSGNGYQTAAPAGSTIDKTVACSVGNVVPWFNITPVEAAQTCAARGGRLCNTNLVTASANEWNFACRSQNTCKWGYAPSGTACTTTANYSNKFCNLGPFDFDGNPLNGNQDGLLPTGSSALQNCWADWGGVLANPAKPYGIMDMTGNLREITFNATASPACTQTATNSTCLFTLMGGAYNSDSENGASCDFTFFTVDAQYKLFDVGFRCCYDSNPS
jgi:hypothetical protein